MKIFALLSNIFTLKGSSTTFKMMVDICIIEPVFRKKLPCHKVIFLHFIMFISTV